MTTPSSTSIPAKFTQGSILHHVLSMSAAGCAGLVAVFFVDLLNLFYISQLGQKELAAAVGYAGTILFFLASLSIGLSIATSALTSRALGKGDIQQARLLAGTAIVFTIALMSFSALLVYPFLGYFLSLLGAKGDTASLALRFTHMVLPSVPLIGIGMCVSALIRAKGDAKNAMLITLIAGLTTAVLDPLFIFGFGLGLDGAAYSTILARIVMVSIGLAVLIKVHRLLAWPSWQMCLQNIQPFFIIAFPAVLTQIATPVGNAFTTAAIGPYGDEAVAGWTVITRIIPVAFVGLFALSGSVGPILGQNLGAGLYPRIKSTMNNSFLVVVVYVLVVWLLLALLAPFIAHSFGAIGLSYEMILFFCYFVAASFIFNGAIFVANAGFNNLGYPFYSTLLNWGRSTLGVIPFIYLGGKWMGIYGILAGYGLGMVGFGGIAIWLMYRVLARLPDSAV
jgi:putative MATE family efflux protein